MSGGAFWWRHARGPLATFVALAVVAATTPADVFIARLFFDPAHGEWVGARNWWVNEFVHTGGRWAVWAVELIALSILIASLLEPSLRRLRQPAGYFALSVALTVGIVGLLKTVTNVDCPWDLAEFGGGFPFVHLFADRPDALRHAQCFPAAHASSGYAMFALYFAFRERCGALARTGLGIGLAMGLGFGICQQSRGAHFASHDLWSAAIAWTIALSVYAFVFRARLWHANPESPRATAGFARSPHDTVAPLHAAVERDPAVRARIR
jgi:membrane-associated PAP2 superfamily phosphatase